MPSPLSVDSRERVLAAVEGGGSFHRAAARFGVSVSSASRWSQRFAQQGHVAPKPAHSDGGLPAIEAHADLILSPDEARPELFLRGLRDALSMTCRPARAGCHASSLATASPAKRDAVPG
jgi:transposase-like protein